MSTLLWFLAIVIAASFHWTNALLGIVAFVLVEIGLDLKALRRIGLGIYGELRSEGLEETAEKVPLTDVDIAEAMNRAFNSHAGRTRSVTDETVYVLDPTQMGKRN